jgi:deoxyribodipyrimidine photo-lyase
MTSLAPAWAIHWFRRDLRVRGNEAFYAAGRRHGGRVLGVFALDPVFLAREDFSPRRFAFFLATLVELRRELRELGSDLLVLERGPEQAFGELLSRTRPAEWSFNRDYEPFARARDARIEAWLLDQEIPVCTGRDHLLVEPAELHKDDGTFYQVFTPFAKKWGTLAQGELRERVAHAAIATRAHPRFNLTWRDFPHPPDVLEAYVQKYPHPTNSVKPGTDAALERLREFGRQRLEFYSHARDLPAVAGTSGLSVYFKNGSLTVPQVIAELGLPGKHGDRFLSELVWREFYYHLLWHLPEAERQALQPKYRAIPWENREDHFAAWREGRTGFPLVDAGMRELAATGWMHNRVRMVVASFLTKDLHIDWRWGERHFMRELLDGDLAPNNGGWQWAASTGCDAQPYFRVFNPTRQSERFDVRGEYIRRWIPELRDTPEAQIHEPWAKGAGPRAYPHPIVDHASRAKAAIAMYKHAGLSPDSASKD